MARLAPVLRSRLLGAITAAAGLVAAWPAAAQEAPPVMTPGGMVREPMPGEYVVVPGDVITWTVVFDNELGTAPMDIAFVDVFDAAAACAPGVPACPGSGELLLLCPAAGDPWAPDAVGGTVDVCDAAAGRLEMSGIPVAVGAIACVRFSTRVALRAVGEVSSIGCWTDAVAGSSGMTTTYTEAAPHCAAGLPGLAVPACSSAGIVLEPPLLVAGGVAVRALAGGAGACGAATDPAFAGLVTTPCGSAPDLASARLVSPIERASLASGAALLPGEALALSPFETDVHGDTDGADTVLILYGADAAGTLRLAKSGEDVTATLLP